MIEFPELQQALVEAAGRRRRRAPQLVRPVLIAAAACAVAVVAVLVLTRPPNDERTAAPRSRSAGGLRGLQPRGNRGGRAAVLGRQGCRD